MGIIGKVSIIENYAIRISTKNQEYPSKTKV